MRVLYVATDLRDADILQQEVRRASPDLTFDMCAGLAALRARADAPAGYDVLLMDCGLPETEQLQLMHYVRVRQLGLPIVALASANGPVPAAALTAGADDVILRGPKAAERLAPALRLSAERSRTLATTLRENDKLKRSEARLRLIIEALPTGVVLLDQAGKVLAMNAAGVQIFGSLSPQDIVGRLFATMIPVEDQPGLRAFLDTVANGDEASLQFSSLHDDEMPQAFTLRGLCIQRDHSGPNAVLGVIERVPVALSAQHTWSSDFDLGVGGLPSPLLDPDATADAMPLPDLASAGAVRALELESRCRAAESRAALLEAELASAQAALADADSQQHHAADRLREIEADAAIVAGERDALHQALAQFDARIRDADTRAALVDGHWRDAETRVAETDERVRDLASEIAAARQVVEEQRASLDAQAVRAADQDAALREKDELLGARVGELTASAAQVAELSAKAAALDDAQAALERARKELEESRAELLTLTRTLAAHRATQEQLQAALSRKEAEAFDGERLAQARIAELEREQHTLSQRVQALLDQAAKASAATARGLTQDPARRGSERLGRLAAAMAGDLHAAIAHAADALQVVAASIGASPSLSPSLAPSPSASTGDHDHASQPGAPSHDAVEHALEAILRGGELARHLLRLSARYMGQSSHVDLGHVLRQQDALLRYLAGPDVDLHLDLAPGLVSSDFDTQDLSHVVTSLVVAARDALPLGGTIRVATVAQTVEPHESPRADRPRPLVLSVMAKGYGIRPVSSTTCEEVTERCGGLLTTVIEPNASWTLRVMLPGSLAEQAEAETAPRVDLTRSA